MKIGLSTRKERVTRGGDPGSEVAAGVSLLEFASSKLGAVGFTTGVARFAPGAVLPYHVHNAGESVTVVQGKAEIAVEDRTYVLTPFDSLHIPSGVAHRAQGLEPTTLHVAWASAEVTRTRVDPPFKGRAVESLRRFAQAEEYELSKNARFRDLFAARFGSKGICGGYGRFAPGASLPCHMHEYDESITIIEGVATCRVAGRKYSVGGCDTALVPKGFPHRFINDSDQHMAMIWVYAGDEPARTVVDDCLCMKGFQG